MQSLFANHTARIMAAGVVAFGSAPAFADDNIDIQAMGWASACVTCHGAAQAIDGSSVLPLAGMASSELVAKMTAFAQGDMPGSLMQQIARGYDTETLQRIAQWYEKQGEAR